MARKSRRSPAARRNLLALSGLAALAIVTAAVVGAAVLAPKSSGPVSDQVASYQASPHPTSVTPVPGNVASAVGLLSNKARPWTLQVVGDSTGASPVRWVHVLAERMSTKYDRPVELHDWVNDSNSYAAPVTVGAGTGAPIIIWNGSASGKGTQYALDNWKTMVTDQPDLFVINHGLNMPDATSARSGVSSIISRALTQWPTVPAFALTIQSPRLDAAAATEDSITAALRTNWSNGPVALIDVYKAFKDHGNVASLLISDQLHPSAQGAAIWADTVQKSLGL